MAMEITSKKFRRFILIFWIVLLSPIIIMILLAFGISMNWFGELPKLEDLDNPLPNQSTEVYSDDRVLLGTYYLQNRNTCEFSELPAFLVNALVAREDHRFYKHSGIDFPGLMRVVVKTILFQNHLEGGGSTITQQLAKSLFPRDEDFKDNPVNMAMTKFKEWVIAIRLERKYSKQEIIALYLNSVQFTPDVYGIKAASRVFFNKVPAELKVEEAAMLVGILKGISMYNPQKNPTKAFNRRNSVLRKMYEH